MTAHHTTTPPVPTPDGTAAGQAPTVDKAGSPADRLPRGQQEDAAADAEPRAGIAREVGDLDDPDAVEEAGALPGRAGGGLAGG